MTNPSLSNQESLESLVAHLVDEFQERQERGECPRVEEYVARHPRHAAMLRQVLAALELLGVSGAGAPPARPEGPTSGVLGDYRLIREVGRGGMGVVYEAEQISLDRRVALKVLPFAATMDPRHLQRFHNEARAAASLHHEHIVPVYGVGQERGVHYFAMQFIDGQTLADFIDRLRCGASAEAERTTACVPVPDEAIPAGETVAQARETTGQAPRDGEYFRRVAGWSIQAAEALEYAHAMGVVHRDVKPGNLMIDGRGSLWVTDFGLARTAADSNLTMTGDLLGTLRYMSPEQAMAKRMIVDHRSDVYSLGVTLYELLTLQPAILGQDRQEMLRKIAFEEPVRPHRINKGIPTDLETIVIKATEKNPADRYGSAQDLAEDLRRYLEDKPIHGKRPTVWQTTARWARKNKAIVWSASLAMAAVLLITGVMIGLVAGDRMHRQSRTEQAVQSALEESEALQKEHQWEKALSAVKRAQAVLDGGVARGALKQRVLRRLEDLELVVKLEQIWLHRANSSAAIGWDNVAADRFLEEAFRTYRFNVLEMSPSEAAERIRASSVSEELILTLYEWALIRDRVRREHLTIDSHLIVVALAADTDPFRKELHTAWAQQDTKRVMELAASVSVAELPPRTVHRLSYMLMATGKTNEGISILRQAQERHPRDFLIHFRLANLLERKGSGTSEETLFCLAAAWVLRPENLGVSYKLGILFDKKGDGRKAMEYFRKALKLQPKSPEVLLALGDVCRKQNKLEEAYTAYEQAFQVKNRFVDIYWHTRLAQSFVDLGELYAKREVNSIDKAIVAYERAISLHGDFVSTKLNEADGLMKQGKLQAAEDASKEASEGDDEFASACNNLAWLLATCQDPKFRDARQAVQLAHKAVTLAPDKGVFWKTLGVAQFRAANWKSAVEALHQSMQFSKSRDSSNWLFLAMAHWHLGDTKQARHWFDRAVASMNKKKRQGEELERFRAEAAALLGIQQPSNHKGNN